MKVEIIWQIILPLITTVATCAIGYLFNKFKQREKKRDETEEKRLEEAAIRNEAIRAGLLALCRDRILQGYRYYKSQGGISAQDLESMNKLYFAYHNLGGNGTITKVYEEIIHLPLKEGL